MGSLVFLLLLMFAAIAAPLVAPTHYNDQDYVHTWEGPSAQYLAGTDGLGRDVVSRLIYGARISLSVALVAQAFMLLFGVTFGLLAGWFGKWVDIIISRFVDIMFPFPHLLLIVMIMTYLKGSLMQETGGALGSVVALNRATGGLLGVFIAMGLTWWLPQCRLVRGMVLSLKERDFITAARALGASNQRILRVHLLPNTVAPIIVAATVGVPAAIILEAGISFLGLGVDPPIPSWGLMISDGMQSLQSSPHLIIAPSILMSVTLLAINFVGDGLRDALDPLMRE